MKLNKIVTALFIGVMSTSVMAYDAGMTMGLNFGQLDVDISGVDGENSTGFSLGYDFGNNWSAELAMNYGSADAGFNMDIDTTAFYATYRSSNEGGYVLTKIGYLIEDVSASGYSESDTGMSYGLGAGYHFNTNLSLEAEYTIVESDVNMLGFGLRYAF